ncbi:hypothetical protein ACFFSW_28430 [Saccharothrix longispora]|uniref:Integral membrane protein n=1 Tax=Saccharothrix longispora TaxID=33920 RepID=A0ABU1Q1W4_9PSEU|nr:hypothetical protein [Saccharothrix longispora]MDR6596661.1 hypothetical protein [Saccharothrix longispora]
MRRVLGIELRRGSALLLGAAVALLVVGLLDWAPSIKNSTAWTRQWSTMAEWARFMLVFAWPLALGVGALQGLRERRSGVGELFSSTPRPRAHRVAGTFGALAVGLVGGCAVVLVVGGVQVASATDHLHWRWVPAALVGALALVAAAWLGWALAQLVASPLLPPVLAVGAMVLMAFAQGADTGEAFRWALLLPFLPQPESAFTSVTGTVSAVQALWWAALATSAFLLVGPLRRRWVAALPVLLAGAVAVPLLPTSEQEARRVDPVAAELVCADGLCLTRAHEDERAALAGPAREALRRLAGLPSPPTSVREVAAPVHQRQPRGPESTDAVWVALDEFTYFRRDPLPADRLVRHLLAGAGTRTCLGIRYEQEDAVRETAARAVMSSWSTGRLEELPGYQAGAGDEADALAASAWDALRALPGAEQAARVQAARDVQSACSGDAYAVLTGTS